MDEFYQMEREFYDEIQTRLSSRAGLLYCIGTPEGTQWVEELLDSLKNDVDTLIMQWTSLDNPYANHAYILAMRNQMTMELWERTFLGKRGMFEGQIYSIGDQHKIADVDLTKYECFVSGVDWGFSHKGCIVVGGIYGGNIDILECIAESRIPAVSPDSRSESWLSRAKELQSKYPGISFYCGVDEPDHINEFWSAGINAYSCKNSVLPGIKLVSSMISTGSLKCLYSLSDLFISFRRYAWSKKEGKEFPLKVDDDEMDAVRYMIYSAWYDRLLNFNNGGAENANK